MRFMSVRLRKEIEGGPEGEKKISVCTSRFRDEIPSPVGDAAMFSFFFLGGGGLVYKNQSTIFSLIPFTGNTRERSHVGGCVLHSLTDVFFAETAKGGAWFVQWGRQGVTFLPERPF